MKIYEIGTGYTPIPAQIPAATESVVEELTKAFMKKEIDVEILDISTKSRANNNLPINEVKVSSFFTKSDVSLGIIHKVKRVVYSIQLAKKIKSILKKTEDKVILHFHNQYNAYFFFKLVSKKLRKKAVVVYTNHNGYWSLPLSETKDTLNKRYFQEIYAMKNADMVFALNEKMKNNIADFLEILSEKIILIPNGVNTDVYVPLSKEKSEQIKEKLKISGKKVILQVGSVYENKGQERLVRMLSPILKENPDLVYAFAGGIVSQEYFDLVNATAKELDLEEQVVYLGIFAPGEEMNEIYNVADIMVFSSKYEAFGLVIVEALSSGTPVIIGNNLMFPLSKGFYMYNNAMEFLDIVDKIIRGEKKQFSDRSEVLEKYGWDAVADQYLNAWYNI